MSDIPKAMRLVESALTLLNEAYALMPREPAVRKAPVTSRRVTEKLVKEMKTYAELYPEASMQEIAERFDVNIGRVSETLTGKRG